MTYWRSYIRRISWVLMIFRMTVSALGPKYYLAKFKEGNRSCALQDGFLIRGYPFQGESNCFVYAEVLTTPQKASLVCASVENNTKDVNAIFGRQGFGYLISDFREFRNLSTPAMQSFIKIRKELYPNINSLRLIFIGIDPKGKNIFLNQTNYIKVEPEDYNEPVFIICQYKPTCLPPNYNQNELTEANCPNIEKSIKWADYDEEIYCYCGPGFKSKDQKTKYPRTQCLEGSGWNLPLCDIVFGSTEWIYIFCSVIGGVAATIIIGGGCVMFGKNNRKNHRLVNQVDIFERKQEKLLVRLHIVNQMMLGEDTNALNAVGEHHEAYGDAKYGGYDQQQAQQVTQPKQQSAPQTGQLKQLKQPLAPPPPPPVQHITQQMWQRPQGTYLSTASGTFTMSVPSDQDFGKTINNQVHPYPPQGRHP